MKTFFIVLLGLLFSQIYVQPVQKYNIEIPEPKKSLLEYDYSYWKEFQYYQKIKLILEMVNSSDGLLQFQIVDSSNEDDGYDSTRISQMAIIIERIEKCVDERGWLFYVSYENDLQIGIVLIECMKQENMFND